MSGTGVPERTRPWGICLWGWERARRPVGGCAHPTRRPVRKKLGRGASSSFHRKGQVSVRERWARQKRRRCVQKGGGEAAGFATDARGGGGGVGGGEGRGERGGAFACAKKADQGSLSLSPPPAQPPGAAVASLPSPPARRALASEEKRPEIGRLHSPCRRARGVGGAGRRRGSGVAAGRGALSRVLPAARLLHRLHLHLSSTGFWAPPGALPGRLPRRRRLPLCGLSPAPASPILPSLPSPLSPSRRQ